MENKVIASYVEGEHLIVVTENPVEGQKPITTKTHISEVKKEEVDKEEVKETKTKKTKN